MHDAAMLFLGNKTSFLPLCGGIFHEFYDLLVQCIRSVDFFRFILKKMFLGTSFPGRPEPNVHELVRILVNDLINR